MPIEQIESVSMLNNDIISNSKFWKLGKHPSPPVRLAFYKVLTALFQRASFLLDDKEKQIINAVFNNLDETDPTVLPYIWQAVLLIVSRVRKNLCKHKITTIFISIFT